MFVPLGSTPLVVALPRDADAADKRLALKAVDSNKKKTKAVQDQWNAMCVHLALDGDADALCSPAACRFARETYVHAMNWIAASVRKLAEGWSAKVEVRAKEGDKPSVVDGQ